MRKTLFKILKIIDLVGNGNNVEIIGESPTQLLCQLLQKCFRDHKVVYLNMGKIIAGKEFELKFLWKLSPNENSSKNLREKIEKILWRGKVILCLDNFDNTKNSPNEFGKDFRSWLRSLTQNYPLRLIIMAKKDLIEVFPEDGYFLPALYDIFEKIYIK